MALERRRTLDMKRKRHTPEEIIKKLREAVCKQLEVSPPTYHRWRQE